MRPGTLLFILSLPFVVLAAPALRAQEVLNWGDFELCDDCGIEITELVRLGDADGPGIIEGTGRSVVRDRELGYLVYAVGGTYIKVFGHDGTFQRKIGREGDGPGEFRGIIDVDVVDGRIVVLDPMRGHIFVLSPTGEYIGGHLYEYRPGRFTPVGDGRIVVTSSNWRSRVVEHPLQMIDVASGVTVLEFGAVNAGERKTDVGMLFGGQEVGSVLNRSRTVWWASRPLPTVQEWSLEGERVRVIEGELPWFPAITDFPDRRREPPATRWRGVALDGEDNLWMLIQTADPEWDEIEMIPGPEGPQLPPGRGDDYRDNRIDVFNLQERRHLGRHVWDATGLVLMNHGGEPAVSVLEYDDAMVPQIVVYGVRVRGRYRGDVADGRRSARCDHPGVDSLATVPWAVAQRTSAPSVEAKTSHRHTACLLP